MAIQFRCDHCQTLMSIASRKAGAVVRCATCDEETLVPLESQVTLAPRPAPPPPPAASLETAEPPAEESHDRVALPDDFFDFDADEAPQPAAAVDEESFQWDELVEAADEEPLPESNEATADRPAARPTPPVSRDGADAERFTVQLRKSSIDDEMDLTPMVDVVFQLLIFFMVTASFALHKTIQTPTPESNQKGATQSIQSLEELEGVAILVRIDAQNSIVIDDDPLADDNRVVEALRDKMRKEHKSEIIITADSAAWHRTVVKVVDAANEVGMQKIRLATRSGSAE